jgi:hypothetical protein
VPPAVRTAGLAPTGTLMLVIAAPLKRIGVRRVGNF